MSRNDELADRFEEFADRLEATGVEYKPQSYRRAAENVRAYPESVESLVADGGDGVEAIEGVGEALAAKIVEYVETGAIEELEELRTELPVDMATLTSVEGVGPKTVGTLYDELGVEDLDDLETVAREEKIREISGFGATSEENILAGIEFARQANERSLLGDARPLGEALMEYVAGGADGAVERCELGGSLRRWRETIGDVDLLVASDDPGSVVERFTDWDRADAVIEAGTSKASLRANGVRMDLRVVVPKEFGSALQYFTGSRDHNIGVRNRAIERDLKVNEYGVFDVSELGSDGSSDESDGVSDVDDPESGQRVGERVAGETEAGMYEAVDLPPIPPELREDSGEIDAAAAGDLPVLVELDAVRGDLHVHTDWSDGKHSIEEMIADAAEFGHEYVCITDHASGPGIVADTGLADDDLREQRGAIEDATAAVDADIDVLCGVEANIDADGGVSVGDEVLDDLDLVVASPHSGLDGDGTDRLVTAIEHPHVDVIGHPTGRYLNRRPGLDLDFERVAHAAAEHGVALEVNANPHRLDLSGGAVRTAIEAGATITVDTDAHRPASYELLRYGVHTARRGWAEVDDVLNARDAAGLRAFLAD
ncbi:PHP domain-containing protein [Halococcus saccharolyticus]|uniref:DNA-directed DNA polymerase n=1 Tax=Halococcus saccharolyticus DSM 5350 TaxID=1227455 RepID=M0MEN3_9EURY|nr:PHP domain-containing protein [Halococcus saccharolyticus]EMA44217.1 PHP domain protein [Halococcus saccharolyticus DSM 5350]